MEWKKICSVCIARLANSNFRNMYKHYKVHQSEMELWNESSFVKHLFIFTISLCCTFTLDLVGIKWSWTEQRQVVGVWKKIAEHFVDECLKNVFHLLFSFKVCIWIDGNVLMQKFLIVEYSRLYFLESYCFWCINLVVDYI